METVLTVTTKSETRSDSSSASQSAKRTRLKKKSTLSGNGNHPSKAFANLRTKTEQQDICWEQEGWRYIEKPSEDGRVRYERVPLTAYELLHPQEGYIIVHASPHDFNTAYIGTSTKISLRDISSVTVLGDVRTDLNLPDVEPISPDISVIFGVSRERIWTTFDCQKEGICPSVVFEITSPGTRDNDFDEKYDYYCRAGIPYYVILDIRYGWDGPVTTATYHLHVFERIGGQYVEMQANREGRCWLPPLKMWVGLGDKGILCYDESGQLLVTPEEFADTLAETERQRDSAVERADEQERIASEVASRAAEQERLAQQAAVRAAEQEQIAQRERMLAQQEAAPRAAEQEQIAQQEAAHAAAQEQIAQQERMLAQQEAARAAEQERIAQEALQAQLAAEAKVAELLAQMAELQAKS